jgi:NAD(P)-dependent dehydrogenase (short-subunit alcohol dehydrogenase family)
LINKTVIVTGGASGIGKTICEEYAKRKWTVIILDINRENGLKLHKSLGKITSCFFYVCDFSNLKSIHKMSKILIDNHPCISCIIHNVRSRYKSQGLLENLNLELEVDFNIYIRSPLILTSSLINNLSKSEDPSVIFVGSTNSLFISEQPISYHICKGSLLQSVRYLAAFLAKKKIRVNLINPGIVNVKERERNKSKIFEEAINSVIPLGRAASTEEIAHLCMFLSSNESRYITGSCITIDGGEHLLDHMSLAQSLLKNSIYGD